MYMPIPDGARAPSLPPAATSVRTIVAADFLDSIAADSYVSGGQTVVRPSRLASLEGTFSGAATLVIHSLSTYSGGQNNMPVFVDGAFYLDAVGNGLDTRYEVNVLPGTHTYKIWAAQQTNGAPNIFGTWVSSLQGAGITVTSSQAASRVLVSFGDSIAGGGNCSSPSRFGINALLRTDYPGRVVDIGYGTLRLADKTAAAWSTDTQGAAALSGASTVDIVNFVGTNDYGLSGQSAASYGTELGAWADSVHVALPAARVFIVEIFPRATETANGLGDTAPNYRTQQANVVSARASFCTLITAASIGLTGTGGADYAGDGLHLVDSGHAKVKSRLKTVLGY